MARFFFYLAFLMMPLLLQGQQQPEWFPVGAEWHYTRNPPSHSTYFNRAHINSTSVKNGISCKKIEWQFTPSCFWGGENDYVYADSNRVYFFNSTTDSFNVLYDFHAQQGDMWTIPQLSGGYDTSRIVFQVDSTDTTTINGFQLKVLYIHDTVARGKPSSSPSAIGFDRQLKIIEYIGSKTGMFPWLSKADLGSCHSGTSRLRCYQAPTFGFYKAPYFSGPCDTVITSLREPPSPSKPRVSISPHPVKHTSTIQLTTSESRKVNDAKCTIYDPLGRKIEKLRPSSSTSDRVQFQINASSWEAGVYIYRIRGKNKHVKTGKIIVK